MISFEIDGREVQAPEGMMLVDAAKRGDVEIPYFCYEPKLGPPVGACRMCLVEIEGMPKLQTACSTPVKDGMVVNTTSDEVKQAQNAVVEFLLVNHPLDCPVCDKGGECPLQDISYGWGAGKSRYIEPKRHFKKPIELSPLIAIDRERCILCYRCVRFSQEVSEDYQLVFLDRGDHTFVGTHDGTPYVGPFSGNIIELCPVGALTSRAYRFRARPWDVEGAGSLCLLCPSPVQRRVHRARRRKDPARARARQRGGRRRLALRQGPLRLPGDPRERPPDRADGARRRRAPARCPGSGRCRRLPRRCRRRATAAAGLAGGEATNEEGFLLQHLIRKGCGSPRVDSRRRRRGFDAEQARVLARPELSAAATDVDGAGAMLVVDTELVDEAPILDLRVRKARAPQRGQGGDAHEPAELAGPERRPPSVRFAPGAGEAALAALAAALRGARRLATWRGAPASEALARRRPNAPRREPVVVALGRAPLPRRAGPEASRALLALRPRRRALEGAS